MGYLAAGELAAAGLGGPLLATVFGALLEALALNFLQRYTLEDEILRSFSMSLVFLPAWISDMTLLQSTLLPAVAQAFAGLKPTFAATISERPATTNASFRIKVIAPRSRDRIGLLKAEPAIR